MGLGHNLEAQFAALPLSLILEALRDLIKGAYGELPPRLGKPIAQAYLYAERLQALVNRIPGPPWPQLPQALGIRPTFQDLQWLDRVREAIETGIEEDSFSVQALAERLAVHRSRLHERLRHLTGLPPVRLIAHWRLERAAALLVGDASVSEAAYAVGFQSVEHFSRSFRKHYGQAPSAYRRAGSGSAAADRQP
jgi:AraC-like DNA-binding protein